MQLLETAALVSIPACIQHQPRKVGCRARGRKREKSKGIPFFLVKEDLGNLGKRDLGNHLSCSSVSSVYTQPADQLQAQLAQVCCSLPLLSTNSLQFML